MLLLKPDRSWQSERRNTVHEPVDGALAPAPIEAAARNGDLRRGMGYGRLMGTVITDLEGRDTVDWRVRYQRGINVRLLVWILFH